MRSLDWLGPYRWVIERRRPFLAAVGAVAAVLFGTHARAGVVTYTFGAPNNNAGTMAIGYPLQPVVVNGMPGYLAFYPTNMGNIITFNVGAAPGETLATKQTKIVNYIKANLPNGLMVGTPANNQVSITIPAATIAALPKGQVPGIGVTATNGVETEGFLRARIQANGDPTVAYIEFDGLFSSTDQIGLTSAFDAGIYSSFGSFDDNLPPSAFTSLDGYDIAQKFLADLSAVASSLHVSLGFFSTGPEDGQIVVSFLNEPVGSNDGISFGSHLGDRHCDGWGRPHRRARAIDLGDDARRLHMARLRGVSRSQDRQGAA